mmetsp:Transcript_96149/g.222903  ORF Transcript_96149/g.222903 Transcript_96149/m.222903 type:complete len:122 (-) Transcript_96149:10-375(-)|eukprot:CAMPEP_0171099316 /NCGR_PEP_ID=MMETSP0766_2-20121228/51097_1 /TAXON_ID=439317 /ORGANISM="Gambierdiscus australes, Strain CAWD 149" /LENGTH=121 /DNA_ID=CAMNT_0011558903 /DNA_START=154 /DNA_END=519 /DNA_ORIENTATION=-
MANLGLSNQVAQRNTLCPGPLCVNLQTLGGESEQLLMGARATVRDLQLCIEERWKLPPESQRLATGTRLLDNPKLSLVSIGSEAGMLPVTLVVTLEALEQRLSSSPAGMARREPRPAESGS